MRTLHLSGLVLAAALGAASAQPAATSSAPGPRGEVADVTAHALKLYLRGRRGSAEAALESLTRSRPDDPAAWRALAELRVRLDAARGARYAFHRAAGLAGANARAAITKRLGQLGLDAPPARPVVTAPGDFLGRARRHACSLQQAARRAGVPPDPDLACDPDRPRPRQPTDFRVTPALVRHFGRDPRGWVRAAVARHAPLEALDAGYLRRLGRERDPATRYAVLRRLFALQQGSPLDEAWLAQLEAWAHQPPEAVQTLAWTLLDDAGRPPALTPAQLVELVVRADAGGASKGLARAVHAAAPARYQQALVTHLLGPTPEGKVGALSLLAGQGGAAGARAVAEAFRSPTGLGLRYANQAYPVLAAAAARQGATLGDDPRKWADELER